MTVASSMFVAACGTTVAVALQELPIPQQWTVIGMLGFLLVAGVWLGNGLGNRFVSAIDRLNATNSELVLELQKLVMQHETFQVETAKKHEEYARERDKAVAVVVKAIEDALKAKQR